MRTPRGAADRGAVCSHPRRLEQALRAQVVWGGRLGTNLIELGCIDLDSLSRALGRQHGLPAALARHFEKADRESPAQLSPDDRGAVSRSCRSLEVSGTPHRGRRARAAARPTRRRARRRRLLRRPASIVVSVAAEMRVRYHLERVYRIQRTRGSCARAARRSRRSRSSTPTSPSRATAIDVSIPMILEPGQPPRLKRAPTAPPADQMTPTSSPPSRRSSTRRATTASAPTSSPAAASAARTSRHSATRRSPSRRSPTAAPGAARAHRDQRVAVGDKDATPSRRRRRTREPASAPRSAMPPDTLGRGDARHPARHRPRPRRRADGRCAPAVPTRVDAALLLVLRGTSRSAGKPSARRRSRSPEIAVPLDQGGLVPTGRRAQRDRAGRRGRARRDRHRLLLGTRSGRDGGDLAIVPIAIAGQVMCVIAVAVDRRGAGRASPSRSRRRRAAAFARLMRDASR